MELSAALHGLDYFQILNRAGSDSAIWRSTVLMLFLFCLEAHAGA